jgi:glycosyltransferase involved in cell wall biosynthesis
MTYTWHLLTGEFPPGCGGVGDYTAALAQALAGSGDQVHVWTPAANARASEPRVVVHVLPDTFGAASRRALARAFAATPGVVLLQYVPNGLGVKGANLAFCRWFGRLRDHTPDVRVMFHEPYFYFTWSRPWAPSNSLAVVQRMMARALLRGASRVYFSTETWKQYLHGPRRGQALPIPSSIPVAGSGARIAYFRAEATAGVSGAPLVGHFGTYGAHVARELDAILPALVSRVSEVRLALIGAGGAAFLTRLARLAPAVAARAWAPDRLEPDDVAAALRACDVLVQPYPDGITTRRTSVMAGLKNGVAIVSSAGALTEPVWGETNAVALAPVVPPAAFVDRTDGLLRDPVARVALAGRGATTYATRFSMEHTVGVLRSARAS